MKIYIHTNIHTTYIHTYVPTYIRTYVHTNIRIHIRIGRKTYVRKSVNVLVFLQLGDNKTKQSFIVGIMVIIWMVVGCYLREKCDKHITHSYESSWTALDLIQEILRTTGKHSVNISNVVTALETWYKI